LGSRDKAGRFRGDAVTEVKKLTASWSLGIKDRNELRGVATGSEILGEVRKMSTKAAAVMAGGPAYLFGR
jgi:hypothetical protein